MRYSSWALGFAYRGAVRYKAFISYSHTSVGSRALFRMRCTGSARHGTSEAVRGSSATSPGSPRVRTCGRSFARHWTSRSTSSTWPHRRPSARRTRQRRSGIGSPSAALRRSFSPSRKARGVGPRRRCIRSGSDALPAVLHTAFEQTPLFVDLRGVAPANCHLSDPLFRDKVATIASALHGRSKDELYGLQVSALIMSDAERMARDAQTALVDRSSDRALLLAAHALRLTEAQGEARVPEAEVALRQTLCRAGGRPLGDSTPERSAVFPELRRALALHGPPGDETRLWDLRCADQPASRPRRSGTCPHRAGCG